MSPWLSLCFSRPVVRRAAYSALVVGTILLTINHGEAILRGDVDRARLLRMALTVLVPYVVSTVSSVITTLELRRSAAPPGGAAGESPDD
jgi:hypothetical protein